MTIYSSTNARHEQRRQRWPISGGGGGLPPQRLLQRRWWRWRPNTAMLKSHLIHDCINTRCIHSVSQKSCAQIFFVFVRRHMRSQILVQYPVAYIAWPHPAPIILARDIAPFRPAAGCCCGGGINPPDTSVSSSSPSHSRPRCLGMGHGEA